MWVCHKSWVYAAIDEIISMTDYKKIRKYFVSFNQKI